VICSLPIFEDKLYSEAMVDRCNIPSWLRDDSDDEDVIPVLMGQAKTPFPV